MTHLPLDESLLFPDDVLAGYAAHLLRQAGARIDDPVLVKREDSHLRFDAVSATGRKIALVAPLCTFAPGIVSFRSILRVKNSRGGPAWLTNGQGSRNVDEIAFFGERGPKLSAPKHACEAYVRSGIPEGAPDKTLDYWSQEIARLTEQLGEDWEIVDADGRRPVLDSASPSP